MHNQDTTRLGSGPNPAPSFWSKVTGIFGRRFASVPGDENMPLPPAPKAPPAPEVIKLARGEGTLLRNALNPEATSGNPPGKIEMMEMPTPSTILPRIVLQVSRTMLLGLRKAPPPPPVTSEAVPGKEPVQTGRLTPETRF